METALLTYPTRYTHSAIETVDERDVRACVELLVAFLSGDEPVLTRSGAFPVIRSIDDPREKQRGRAGG